MQNHNSLESLVEAFDYNKSIQQHQDEIKYLTAQIEQLKNDKLLPLMLKVAKTKLQMLKILKNENQPKTI